MTHSGPDDESQTQHADPVVPSKDALSKIKARRGHYRAITEDDIPLENARLRLEQRRRIANWAGGIAIAQVAIADLVFILYAWLGRHWDVQPGAIEVWLGATVVQVIGVIMVITGSLFPRSEDSPLDNPDK